MSRQPPTVYYYLTSIIGEGTFGSVYRATDFSTRQWYAVKVSKKRKHYESERAILKLLMNHPNVVQLIDSPCRTLWGWGDMKPCIGMVLELCIGDLHQLLYGSHIPLSFDEKKVIMHQLLCGLAYVHANGIIHCDVKPENILVSSSWQFKLSDFGSAVKLSVPKKATNVGTPIFRSPELILEHPNYGTAVDMWSLGCVMAELLIGVGLFSGTDNNPHTLLSMIAEVCGLALPVWNAAWPEIDEIASYPAYYRWIEPDRRWKDAMESRTLCFRCYSGLDGYALFVSMLTLNPRRRITANAALRHTFFSMNLPTIPYIYW